MRKHLQTCTRATCSSIFSVNNIPTEHVLPRVGLPNSTRIAATWHEPSRTLKCVHLTGAPELVQLVGISRWWSLTSTASFREGSRKPRILRCGICGILVASFFFVSVILYWTSALGMELLLGIPPESQMPSKVTTMWHQSHFNGLEEKDVAWKLES